MNRRYAVRGIRHLLVVVLSQSQPEGTPCTRKYHPDGQMTEKMFQPPGLMGVRGVLSMQGKRKRTRHLSRPEPGV